MGLDNVEGKQQKNNKKQESPTDLEISKKEEIEQLKKPDANREFKQSSTIQTFKTTLFQLYPHLKSKKIFIKSRLPKKRYLLQEALNKRPTEVINPEANQGGF